MSKVEAAEWTVWYEIPSGAVAAIRLLEWSGHAVRVRGIELDADDRGDDRHHDALFIRDIRIDGRLQTIDDARIPARMLDPTKQHLTGAPLLDMPVLRKNNVFEVQVENALSQPLRVRARIHRERADGEPW